MELKTTVVAEGNYLIRIDKRAILLAAFVIVILSLPGFVDAVAPGSTWYVRGYVMKSGTTTPISGATVKIYNDGVYRGTVYTSGTGYFSYSTTVKPTNYECGWQVTVIKSGYLTTTRYATPVDYITDMGTIYMNPVPPPPPPTPAVISNVAVTTGGVREVTISWDVDWDDTSTGYLSKCWWSADSSIGSEDLIFSTTAKQASYPVAVPEDKVSLTGGTFYYQIYARNSKNGYYPETYYGPESLVFDGVWIIAPTDDAYTQEWDQYGGGHTYNTDLLYIAGTEDTGFNVRSWLRFDVVSSSCIETAILNVYYDMYYPVGNPGISDIIDAYSSDPNWDETTITHNNAPSVGILLDNEQMYIPAPATGAYQQWDVTAAQGVDGAISITLCARVNGGPYLYSKEALFHQPYLDVTFRGEPEAAPTSQPFVNDDFKGPEINSAWSHGVLNSPEPLAIEPVLSDAYLTYLDDPPQWDNTERGHQLIQDNLDITGSFRLDVGLYWQLMIGDAPNLKLGVEIVGENDYAICEMWYEHGDYWYNDGNVASIMGRFHDDAPNSYTDSDVASTRVARFTIENDSLGVIRMWYSDWADDWDEPRLISSSTDSSHAVREIRLNMFSYAGEDHGEFELEFDYVRLDTTIDVGRPLDGVSQFQNPIIEPNFQTLPIDGWTTPGYGSPVGEAVDTGGGLYSWLVETEDATEDSWCLVQPIIEASPDISDFQYASLHNHRVSFSYFAKCYSTLSNVKAVIRYNTIDDDRWICAGGEWVTLSDQWTKVSGATDYPIPASVDTIEVWMIGQSASKDSDFTGYVDRARLSIVESTELSDDNFYCHDINDVGQAGKGSFTLDLSKALHDGEHSWEFDAASILVLEAFEGYYISSVEAEFTVGDGDAYIGGYDGDTGAFQTNPQGYSTTSYTEVEVDRMEDDFNFWVKWPGRVLSFAYPSGMDWIIEDAWERESIAYFDATYRSYVLDTTTTDGDGGRVLDDYGNSPNPITHAILGLPLHWTVDTSCSTWLRINYTVYYGCLASMVPMGPVAMRMEHSVSLYFHGNT